jgi:hypothetical protein
MLEALKAGFEKFVNDVNTTPELKTALLKYGLLYGVIIAISVMFYYSSIDPKSLTTNKYLYGLAITIPMILVFLYVIPFGNKYNSPFYKFLLVGLFAMFLTTMLYFYAASNSSSVVFINMIMNFLIFAIILFALAMFAYMFSNYLKSLDGPVGFLTYLVFYLPCLMIDFVSYIIKEFKMTTNEIYVLFVIEIVLILIYLYVPKLVSKIIQKDGIDLLTESAFLDIKKVIGNSDQMKIPDDGIFNIQQPTFRREYSLSMWVYLNTQSPSFMAYSRETPIFDYGNGKPKVVYFNNTSDPNHRDKIIVYFTDSNLKPASYEFSITHQKWHNIVFNYTSNHVDLFVNGSLEKTYDFIDNQPNYLVSDNITVGSTNGLDGAICNVRYFTSIQTKSQIANGYNLLMNKNPPTNNL